MSTSLSDITTQIRFLINDSAKQGVDIFTYGSSALFTLTEANVIGITSVLVNDVSSGVSYTFYSTTSKVKIDTPSLLTGDTIEVDYNFYPNYSDTELQDYCYSAMVHISNNNYKTFLIESASYIYPDPDDREVRLIAMVACLLISPDNRSIRTPDLTINVPKDLPTSDKISKLITYYKKDSHGIFTTAGKA